MDFDYIIVGGGTAGCVIAEALTASGRFRVLLAEAGGNPSSPFVGIPAGFARLFKSRLDWALETTAQTHAAGRRIFVPRGKMLGGSSNLNAQIHQWGHPADYDGWADNGAPGWSWADVAPVFAAMETVAGSVDETRGRRGAMRVCENVHVHPAARQFVVAARSEIERPTPTYNGGHYEGAWIAEIAQHCGKRFSAWDAFLKPAARRANLAIMTGSHVARLVIEDGRAIGVALAGEESGRMLRAHRGVVLTAGAIGSPVILMHSGIGPATQLRDHGIEVRHDAPQVGRNLHDHPMAVPTFPTRHRNTYKSAESPINLLRYVFARKGPLASNAAEAVAFGRSDPRLSAPDMELIFAPFEWRNQALDAPHVHAFSIGAVVANPLSRGCLSLRNADPRTAPLIDFGLFSDSEGQDRATMIEALRWAHRVAASGHMAPHLMTPTRLSDDPDSVFRDACVSMQTVYHPAGTCRMGVDREAVVGGDLAVRGVEGVWVADASIMPQIPRGHPNAAVAMIAARAAGFIAAAARV